MSLPLDKSKRQITQMYIDNYTFKQEEKNKLIRVKKERNKVEEGQNASYLSKQKSRVWG